MFEEECTTENGGSTIYHNHLKLQADNILTEKASREVADVVNDFSRIDDVGYPFLWSKADETRLNQLNVDTRKLETPGEWTWAAKEGTDQFEYNHKRLQYFVEHELQTVMKHCDKCKSTGILVGLHQINSTNWKIYRVCILVTRPLWLQHIP